MVFEGNFENEFQTNGWDVNPYWQIMETKSKNRDITQRVSWKQKPEKFRKFYYGNATKMLAIRVKNQNFKKKN